MTTTKLMISDLNEYFLKYVLRYHSFCVGLESPDIFNSFLWTMFVPHEETLDLSC